MKVLYFYVDLPFAGSMDGRAGVWVRSTKGGNDASLLTVFEAPEAAEELADFLNRLVERDRNGS